MPTLMDAPVIVSTMNSNLHRCENGSATAPVGGLFRVRELATAVTVMRFAPQRKSRETSANETQSLRRAPSGQNNPNR